MVTKMDADDRARIEAAVKAAETRTSAEIVVMVAKAATDYRAVELMAAAVLSLALPAILLPFPSISALTIWVAQLVLFGLLATLLPAAGAGRFLVGSRRVQGDARAMAEAEFFAHGLRRTSSRAAVLLFVALREHKVELLWDDAAEPHLGDGKTEPILSDVASRIRAGELTEGLELATARLADCLEGALPPREGRSNELPNVILR
jgi:putative membrane protein